MVTSAVVKAYPPVFVAETPISFSVGSFMPGNISAFLNATGPFNLTFPFNITNPFNITGFPNPFNLTIPTNASWPTNFTIPTIPFNTTLPGNGTRALNGTFPARTVVNDTATFWRGVNAYFAFGKQLCDAGGTGYSYISQMGTGNTSFTFTTNIELPGKSKDEAFLFLQPLFDSLGRAGIPVNNTMPVTSLSWGSSRKGEGDSPGGGRFGTRLFPRENWDEGPKFEAQMAAIRSAIEDGYTFHGVQVAPAEKTAGYPGGSSVNPAFRKTLMHGDLFDRGPMFGTAVTTAVRKAARARFTSWMDRFREVSPGAGAYINEADPEEPDWQTSFFGKNYARLLAIKKDHDPWGLFWAPTTVGSEDWEVRTSDGLLTQNGPLCRVGQTAS